jgi:ATP-dependent helicase HrpB
MLARRVAEERGGRLGDEVGFQIRFHDVSGPRTRIKYVTEGILLRQMIGDPALSGVHTVILDEFHERHLFGDVSLGQALRIQKSVRPDLRIIVMSATLESAPLAGYLAPCAMLRSAGRTHPVAVEYLAKPWKESETRVWDLAAREFDRATRAAPDGDTLIFMPGAYEIARTADAIRGLPSARGLAVYALHGELSERDQDLAVAPCDRRKVVVATNVAETSITIPGVRLVLDSGLARVARFDPQRGINMLLTEKISRASAEQRAGRAGRTAPGRCVRLWTEAEHWQRPAAGVPEIRRVDLAEIVLTLKATALPGGAGGDLRDFPWLDPPDPKSLERAERLLSDLGALTAADGRITPLGRRLVAFPVHPRFARMLLAAGDYGCVRSAALIAALTQDRSILVRREDSAVRQNREWHLDDETESDLLRLRRAWEYARDHDYDLDECRRLGIHAVAARRAERALEYFLGIAAEQGLDTGEEAPGTDGIRKSMLAGFSDQLARQAGAASNRYVLVHGRAGTLARESVVRSAPLLVAAEIREIEGGKGGLSVVLGLCTAVRREWLDELYAGDLKEARSVVFDEASQRVVARQSTVFRDLALEARLAAPPAPAEAAALLAEEVLAGRLALKRWDHAVEQWALRLDLLAQRCPELRLPALDNEARRQILRQICLGAFSYKEAKERPVWPAVNAWLSPPQRALLQQHAPERLSLPNGRTPAIRYAQDAPPSVALRIQELYGVTGEMRIAMGRVPVAFQVLAPNQRPVQITSDLAGFWRNDYPRVKRELRRKYPKHEWR